MAGFVIVVDAQRDFMMPDGALYVAGAEALVAPMQDWIGALDPAGTVGVLLTFDTHDADSYRFSAEAAAFPLHCVKGRAGWDSVLDPSVMSSAIPLYSLEKGVFAMWEEPDVTIRDMRAPDAPATPRDPFFDGLRQRGVRDVTVVGVAADYCVRWAVEGLLERGFRVTVPAGLTRGIVRQIDAVADAEWGGRDVAIG